MSTWEYKHDPIISTKICPECWWNLNISYSLKINCFSCWLSWDIWYSKTRIFLEDEDILIKSNPERYEYELSCKCCKECWVITRPNDNIEQHSLFCRYK